MIRVFFVIAIISLVGITLIGQQKITSIIKTSGGSFTEGVIGAPRFLNPVLAQSQTDKDLTQLVFGSLLHVLPNNEIDYELAENLDVSEDKKTYVLTLRKDIFFHDGNPITSDDVLFTIKQIQDPLIKSPIQARWEGVSVEKIDEHTIEFKLVKAYVDFPHNLTIGILPKKVWENISPDQFIFSIYNTNPIGSGSYKVDSIQVSSDGIPQSYTLKRYKKGLKTYIQKITLYFFENKESLIKAYNNGSINTLYGISTQENKINQKKNVEILSEPLPRIFGVFFNQNKQEILKDINVRKAINHSINKEKIIQKVFLGNAIPINNFTGIKQTESVYDKEKVASLLKSSNWEINDSGIYEKEGKLLNFNLSIPNVTELKQVAELIQADLLENGIVMEIKIFDQGDLTQNVIRPRDYEAILFGYMIEKKTDLYAFWHSSQKSDPGLNISLYSNKTIDDALEKLRASLENFDEKSLGDEINKDLTAIFLYSPKYTYILPNKIKGLENVYVTNEQNRYASIHDWYIQTRRVWNGFIK